MIAIIDYKIGNLKNLVNAFNFIGTNVNVVDKPSQLKYADKIVIPGVGSFNAAMRNFNKFGFSEVIKEKANKGTIILGVCVGMQLLFETSLENGNNQGLSLITGDVKKLYVAKKIPHTGWNLVEFMNNHPLISNIYSNSWFYFVHSYFVLPNIAFVIGQTNYYQNFCSIVCYENIWGTQFHPEKSQINGLKLLKNFVLA